MHKDLQTLLNQASAPIFRSSQNKYFLTQKEFEENYGELMEINRAVLRLDKILKKYEEMEVAKKS